MHIDSTLAYVSYSVISEIHTSGKITRIVLNKMFNINVQRENRILFSEQNYFLYIGPIHIHTW